MLVKRVYGDTIDIHLLGIKHSSSHDTEYVRSKIQEIRPNLAFIEKCPNVDLSDYGLQLRKIFGYLRENEVSIVEFDTEYANTSREVPDSLSLSDEQSRYKQVKQIRNRIKDNKPDMYKRLFKQRERRMKSLMDSNISSNKHGNVAVVVGSAHIPPLHEYAISRVH